MTALDLLHRWTGGIVGLVLAILGVTGAILVHKDEWIGLPHAGDPLRTQVAVVGPATARMLSDPQAQGVVYASTRLGLHQVRGAKGSGAYFDQAGTEVVRWASQWERPELWIFDLHHHLFTGEVGETIAGIAGLSALFFVISGTILWWRTRRTFRLRLWPRRMTRPAIVMQHRDLGIVVAPLLFLSALTGAMMLFKPVGAAVVAPFSSPSAVRASIAPPKVTGGPLSKGLDWTAMLTAARQAFPRADFRILSLPRKPGEPITLRMKQPEEWLPNGRTYVMFDAAAGRILATRDANGAPTGAKIFNAAYPLHAGKVGGLPWRLVMTLSGLAMALLGSLAVWTFWFRRPKVKR